MLRLTKIAQGYIDLTNGESVGPSVVVTSDAGIEVSIPLESKEIMQTLAEMWVRDTNGFTENPEDYKEGPPESPEYEEDYEEDPSMDMDDYESKNGAMSL